MTREEQDKRWNDLSEEKQLVIKNLYKGYSEGDLGAEKCFEELYGKHNLQPKLTYEDVARDLFGNDNKKQYGTFCCPVFSEEHSDKLSAINVLLCTAKYLNKNEDGSDWVPDWSDGEQEKCFIGIDNSDNKKLVIKKSWFGQYEIVYFRTDTLAQQAIEILGKDVVRTALGNY